MNPRCQTILERLVEATTGTVPPAERAGIAEHLATCSECRTEASELESIASLLRVGGETPAPPGFWADFNARVGARVAEEHKTVGGGSWRWMRPRPVWGALAVTAAAASIAVAVRVAPIRQTPDTTAASARSLVTETMATTLPSLDDLLKTWRAGLNPETLVPD